MKFTDKAPTIETPTYIKPGVDKKALGDLFSNALKAGETIHTNYQLGSLRDKINTEVKGYEDTNQAYETGMAAGQVAGGQQMAIDALWEGANPSGVDTQTTAGAITKLEADYQSNLQKFQAAKEQGKISEEELIARINKTTREFVNRNPWMEQELYQAAQTHLKNTGVADILKYRQDIAKEESKSVRDDYKAIRNQLLQANIPGGWAPGMPMDEMLRNLMFHQKQQYTTDVWKNWGTVSKEFDKQQIQAMLPTLYKDGIYSITNNKNREWANQLSQLQNPGKITEYLEVMRQDAANEVLQMRMRLADAGVAHTDEAKEAIKNFEDGFNNSIAGLTGVADGKKAAEILQNRASFMEAGQRIGVMTQVNKVAWDMTKDMLGALPESLKKRFVLTFGLDRLTSMSSKLFDTTFSATPEVQEFIKGGSASELFGGVLEAANTNPNNPTFSQGTLTLVQNFNKAFVSGQMSPVEIQTSISANLAHIAKNKDMFAVHLNPELASAVKPQVDTQMGFYGPRMFQAAQGHMKKNPGLQVTYDVTPSGGLVVYSNDPDVSADLNRNFVRQVNNALDAWANVNGISREKAAPEFYQQYFGSILADDPDIGGKGTNPEKPQKKETITPPDVPVVYNNPDKTGVQGGLDTKPGFHVRSLEELDMAFKAGKMKPNEYEIIKKFFQE